MGNSKAEIDVGRSPEEPKSGGGVNARVVLHAVRRHPIALALVILLAAGAGAGIWFFLPLPKMTAAVVFHVSSQVPAIWTPAGNHTDFAAYKQSQAALVKSRRTLNAALKDPAVNDLGIVREQADAIDWLGRNLKVDFRDSPEYMRVTLEGNNADELQTLLGGLAKAYKSSVDEHENALRQERYDGLVANRKRYQGEIDALTAEVNQIVKTLHMPDLPTLIIREQYLKEEQKLVSQELSSLLRLKMQAEDDLGAATWTPNSALAAVTGATGVVSGSPPPWLSVAQDAVDVILQRDPEILKLDDAVNRAGQRLKDTLASFVDQTTKPAMNTINAAREDLKAAVEKREKYRAEARPAIEAALRQQAAQAYETRLANLRTAVEGHTKKIEVAKSRIKVIEDSLGDINVYRSELDKIGLKKSQYEKLVTDLTADIEKMNVEGKARPRVTLSEEPFVVAGLEGNRRLKYALGATLGMFLAGFAGLVWWEHRRHRVITPDEISTEVGARLIGTIPPLAADPHGGMTGASHAVLVEAIDTTRTMIVHATPEGAKLRTLLVTSAVSREGKTTLSGHLAISLTRAGFRTLLVDGDLHAPSVHDLFDLPAAPGLSELLREEVDLVEAIRPSPVPGLSVLPAGKWTLATRQMLGGDRWRRLKREMESRYDFVVIDTAPLLLVSDTLLLAREADGVVLSVLLGVSQIGCVAETVDRLQAIGANLIGVVVNNAPSDTYRQGYRPRSKYPAVESAPETRLDAAVAGSAKEE
jgi:capsular exopolysaccharide synthesis family protein